MNMFVLLIAMILADGSSTTGVSTDSYTKAECEELYTYVEQAFFELHPDGLITHECTPDES